jgi:glycine/serine hydroxymethyltransferase
VNLSGKLYRVVSYGLNKNEEIDYEEAEKTALRERPKLIVTGASAYSRVIDWQRFRAIADKCGALLMSDMAHYAGLVATGLYPSPMGVADSSHHQHEVRAAARWPVLGKASRRKPSTRRLSAAGRAGCT